MKNVEKDSSFKGGNWGPYFFHEPSPGAWRRWGAHPPPGPNFSRNKFRKP